MIAGLGLIKFKVLREYVERDFGKVIQQILNGTGYLTGVGTTGF